MIEHPNHLYTRQADILHLEAMIQQLPDEARVELHLTDGARVTGTVATRPSVQVFRDSEGAQGFNAVVRIDDQQHPEHAHYIWLDRIAQVVHLGSA